MWLSQKGTGKRGKCNKQYCNRFKKRNKI